MSEGQKEAGVQSKKMNVDNCKCYLIGLYFDVSLSYDDLIAANNRSHELYLNVLDMEANIRTAENETGKEQYIGQLVVLLAHRRKCRGILMQKETRKVIFV